MNTTSELAKRDATLPTKGNAPTQRENQTPLVDVYENADELLLVADMPGVTPDEVAISLDKNQLTIQSQRASSSEAKPLATEFTARDYLRSFTIPQGYDLEKVKAEFANGVLSLHMPKSPAIKPRQIQVKAG